MTSLFLTFVIEAWSLTGSRATWLASLAPATTCHSLAALTHLGACSGEPNSCPHVCRSLRDHHLSLPMFCPYSSSLPSACYLARLDLQLLILLPDAGIPGVCNWSPLLVHSRRHSSAFVTSSPWELHRSRGPFLGKGRAM